MEEQKTLEIKKTGGGRDGGTLKAAVSMALILMIGANIYLFSRLRRASRQNAECVQRIDAVQRKHEVEEGEWGAERGRLTDEQARLSAELARNVRDRQRCARLKAGLSRRVAEMTREKKEKKGRQGKIMPLRRVP